MIRTEAIVNYGGLNRMSTIVRTMPQAPIVIGQNVLKKYERQILDELSYTPPAAKSPIYWAPAKNQAGKTPNVNYYGQRYYSKQKAAYFATDGFGGGIPSRRTGKMTSAWRIMLLASPGGMAIRVFNPVPYTMFVVGKLRPRGANPMQAMHKITGWQPVSKTIEFWSVALAEETQKELQAWLDSVK